MDKKVLEAKNRILDIIYQLRPLGFDEVLYSPADAWKWFYDNRKRIPSNINYDSGATRMVIWDEDYCDYVMKFDICACGLEYADSYCQNEADVYKKAVDYGLEDKFAWIEKIGEFGATELFAMDYHYCDECHVTSTSYEHRFYKFCDDEGYSPDSSEAQAEFDNSWYSYDCDNQDAMFELMEDIWGDKEEWKVESFLRDMNVHDIHSGNISLDGDKLVIIDYASF